MMVVELNNGFVLAFSERESESNAVLFNFQMINQAKKLQR